MLFQLLQKDVLEINGTHQKGVAKTEYKAFGTCPELEDETLLKVYLLGRNSFGTGFHLQY